jgi:hypothetical protein
LQGPPFVSSSALTVERPPNPIWLKLALQSLDTFGCHVFCHFARSFRNDGGHHGTLHSQLRFAQPTVLRARLEALGELGAVRLLESLWLVTLNDTATEVRDALVAVVDADDSIAVVELKAGSNWASIRANESGVAWLRTNIMA